VNLKAQISIDQAHHVCSLQATKCHHLPWFCLWHTERNYHHWEKEILVKKKINVSIWLLFKNSVTVHYFCVNIIRLSLTHSLPTSRILKQQLCFYSIFHNDATAIGHQHPCWHSTKQNNALIGNILSSLS